MPEDPPIRETGPCPFCTLPMQRILAETRTAMLVLDAYPVSDGHALVIPKRHVASWFDATPIEQREIPDLLAQSEHAPDGNNIDINDGPAAGKTVPHLDLRLILRYLWNSEDPRGGVHWIIPENARYWPRATLLVRSI